MLLKKTECSVVDRVLEMFLPVFFDTVIVL